MLLNSRTSGKKKQIYQRKSKSFLLKHQLLPPQDLLWRKVDAFLEETDAGDHDSSILPHLPPSSSASAAPWISHGPVPALSECAWPPPAGAASDPVPSSQSAASAAARGSPVQCHRTSSLPVWEGKRGQPQSPLSFIFLQSCIFIIFFFKWGGCPSMNQTFLLNTEERNFQRMTHEIQASSSMSMKHFWFCSSADAFQHFLLA